MSTKAVLARLDSFYPFKPMEDLAQRAKLSRSEFKLLTSGTVERDGEVIHLIAERLEDHGHLRGKLETRSRDFQ